MLCCMSYNNELKHQPICSSFVKHWNFLMSFLIVSSVTYVQSYAKYRPTKGVYLYEECLLMKCCNLVINVYLNLMLQSYLGKGNKVHHCLIETWALCYMEFYFEIGHNNADCCICWCHYNAKVKLNIYLNINGSIQYRENVQS